MRVVLVYVDLKIELSRMLGRRIDCIKGDQCDLRMLPVKRAIPQPALGRCLKKSRVYDASLSVMNISPLRCTSSKFCRQDF